MILIDATKRGRASSGPIDAVRNHIFSFCLLLEM